MTPLKVYPVEGEGPSVVDDVPKHSELKHHGLRIELDPEHCKVPRSCPQPGEPLSFRTFAGGTAGPFHTQRCRAGEDDEFVHVVEEMLEPGLLHRPLESCREPPRIHVKLIFPLHPEEDEVLEVDWRLLIHVIDVALCNQRAPSERTHSSGNVVNRDVQQRAAQPVNPIIDAMPFGEGLIHDQTPLVLPPPLGDDSEPADYERSCW